MEIKASLDAFHRNWAECGDWTPYTYLRPIDMDVICGNIRLQCDFSSSFGASPFTHNYIVSAALAYSRHGHGLVSMGC